MAQVQVPFSYVQQVQSPAQSILQGYQAGQQMQEQRRQRAMAEQAAQMQQQQAAQFQQAFKAFATNPNKSARDYAQLIAIAPKEMVSSITSVYNAMTEEQQGVEKRQAAELISAFKTDPQRGLEILDTRIEAAKNAGNMEELQALQAYRKTAEIDPEAVVEAVALQAGMAFGGEFLKQIPGLSEKKVQSTLRIPDTGTFVTVFTDGTSQAVDDAGNVLTGEARAEAIREAQERGIDIQRGRAGARERGKISVLEGGKALDAARAAQGNIANLKEAQRLIAEEGATTGIWAQYLPAFRDATRELRNMQRRLGLDVIGSVTFGALSQSELDLALNTALDLGMSGPGLVDKLDELIAAQEKVAKEQEKLAEYLLRGGDLGTYLAESRSPTSSGQPTRTADDILAELRASGSL